jgi:EAL domain-containing protein (putative c-di-GMP-specific phosphodiesterase class I)
VTSESAFSFAFQPIIDLDAGGVFAQEALIRGTTGEPAASVLSRYSDDSLLTLDHEARIRAIQLAQALGLKEALSLNFSPAVLSFMPDSISKTIDAARAVGLIPSQLILEVTEGAVIHNPAHFASQINDYRTQGVRLAIDDFGAGYAGLNLLAEFQPDIVKIDMGLVRHIDSKGPRQAIARAIIQVCSELGLDIVAEGIESRAEFQWFAARGVHLFQGFLFGRPAFQQIVKPTIPARKRTNARPPLD